MDQAPFETLNRDLRHPVLDVVMPVLSDKDYLVLPGIFVGIVLLFFGGARQRVLLAALIVGGVITDKASEDFLKPLIAKDRPYAALAEVNVHRGGEWQIYDADVYGYDDRQNYSFPSSHAANIALVATVIILYRRRNVFAAAPLALGVGYSRVYTGNHYPVDVIGGWMFGVAVGLCVWWLVQRIAHAIWGEGSKGDWPDYGPEMGVVHRIILIWIGLNIAYLFVSPYGLAGDEAQYWDWSRRLDWGYYSKPPMIAYVMRGLTQAGGDEAWAIRMGAIFFTSGAAYVGSMLARDITGRGSAAIIAIAVALAIPAAWAGSQILTIDPLLIFFWSLAIYSAYHACRGAMWMWPVLGFALGAGMLSKYTMAVVFVGIVGYIVQCHRNELRKPGLWLAIGIAIAMNAGVIVWNAQRDWISFRHTAAIGAAESPSLLDRAAFVGEFIGSQAGVVSPILFVFAIIAGTYVMRNAGRDKAAAFLAWSFWPLILFYLAIAITRKPYVNWPLAAYAVAGPLVAWWWYQRARSVAVRRWLVAAMVLGIGLGIVTRAAPFLYTLAQDHREARRGEVSVAGIAFDADRDPTNALIGGRELGEGVGDAQNEYPRARFVFSDRYMLTALASFYTPGNPHALCANIDDRRLNQYDLWNEWTQYERRDGIYVTGGSSARARLMINNMVKDGFFESGDVIDTVEVYRGPVRVKQFTLCYMRGYSGKPWNEEGTAQY